MELAREPVLDVPSIGLLVFERAEEMVAKFEVTWGLRPKAVVLPVLSSDGVNFDNPCCLPLCRWVESGNSLGLEETEGPNLRVDFASIVFAFLQLGCDIYLSVEPTMSFINDNPSLIVDSVGDSSRQACLAKNHNHDTLSEILAEGIILVNQAIKAQEASSSRESGRFRGIVFDMVNVWPMSATDGRIELSCFCEECIPQLERSMRDSYDPSDVLGHFRDFPSPANVLLADSGTGIKYEDRVMSTMNSNKVVALCKMKGFQEAWKGKSDKELADAAGYLLCYLRARHRQTVEAVHAIFEATRTILRQEDLGDVGAEMELILLLEGEAYNWTSGLFLDWIDKWSSDFDRPPCDEAWFNATSVTPPVTQIRTRAYMWRRSRYVIDTLFDAISSMSSQSIRVTTGWVRFADEEVRMIIRDRLNAALAGRSEGLTSIKSLGAEDSRVGFVGVAFDEHTVSTLIGAIPIAEGRGQRFV